MGCHSSRRDQVSYYEASANAKGGVPRELHTKDNLLLYTPGLITFSVYYANQAAADIVLKTALELESKVPKDIEWRNRVKDELRAAFQCWIRLNCPINNAVWQSQSLKKRIMDENILEVEALCHTFKISQFYSEEAYVHGIWDAKFRLLQRAVCKCESLFDLYQYRKKRKKNNSPVTTKESKQRHS